jgi:Mrp family chromosome partitioning ATPase
VPAYPKKLPTVLIASLATLVLMSGMVLTGELLASAATRVPGRAAGKAFAERTAAPVRAAAAPAAPAAPAAARATTAAPLGRRWAGRGSFTERIAAVIRRPRLAGIPISALEEFADNLRRESEDGTQIAVLGVAPGMHTTGAAITFARALADEARVVLVGLGAGDAEIEAISGNPSAAGLAELAQGAASFADIITKDKYSALHLIVSGRAPADRGALLSASGMAKNFGALAATYGHVVIDGGAIGSPDFGQDMAALAEIAPHALLLVETLSSAATADAHDRLLEAGFGHVTIIVTGRASTAPFKSAAAA